MKGIVDNYGRAMLEVAVSGIRREIAMLAVIDTGFEGDICLPVDMAIQLGLELWGREEIQLADGSIRKEIAMLAVVDTGFDGDICLPVNLAIQLGLELRGKEEIQLADGSIKNELVFKGSIIFGEEHSAASCRNQTKDTNDQNDQKPPQITGLYVHNSRGQRKCCGVIL
ncbi:MAG: hypothetical protein QME81_01195 [bacterium]|nr:hypothetical protein [bacterium]